MLPWAIGTIAYDVWLKKTGQETISEWMGRHPEVAALVLGVMYYHLNRKGI